MKSLFKRSIALAFAVVLLLSPISASAAHYHNWVYLSSSYYYDTCTCSDHVNCVVRVKMKKNLYFCYECYLYGDSYEAVERSHILTQ